MSTTDRYPDAELLIAEVVEESGLDDFGPGDFRTGLGVFLESLRNDAGLDPSTDPLVLGDIRRRLHNRLLVEDWYAKHPEIDDLPVRGPVDISGLPRTGHHRPREHALLDPQFRSLRGWEQKYPSAPGARARRTPDWRRRALVEENANLPAELPRAASTRSTQPWRTARPSVCRSRGSSSRCRCTATTSGGATPTSPTATCTSGAPRRCCSHSARPTSGSSRRPTTASTSSRCSRSTPARSSS
ncbi:MAG: hypothetical protein U0W40_15880 [Acidimicrobiia bacterium]